MAEVFWADITANMGVALIRGCLVAAFAGAVAVAAGAAKDGTTAPESVTRASAGQQPFPPAPEFEVEDQFRKRHAFTLPRRKPTVLVLGDRKSGRQGEKWAVALWDRYQDAIIIEGLGVGRGVPKWERRIIRFILRKITPYPILLDWDGAVGRAYGFERRKPNVVVIDPPGRVRLKLPGKATADHTQRVFEVLDAVVAEEGQEAPSDDEPVATPAATR